MLREPFGGCDRGYNGTPPFQHFLVERHERRAQLCREGHLDRIGAAEQEIAGDIQGALRERGIHRGNTQG